MTNLNGTDRKILIVALAILALFSYFLYDDSLLFPRKDNSGLERVGEIYFSTNDVRLKTATAFSWLPAQKTDGVHLNDAIFTGERSQAAVQLKDGSVISLKENSLVTMNMKDGQMTLDLKYGDIDSKLSAGSSMKLESGGKTYEIQGPGNIHLSKTSGGDVDITVKDGNAKVRGANGQVVGAKKVESHVDLLTPENVTFHRANENDPLELRWKGTKVSDYQYEICSTPDCAAPLKSRATRDQKLALREPLKDGKYYWRVKGFDRFGHEVARSKTQSLVVSAFAAPKITTPPEWTKAIGSVHILNSTDPVLGATKLSWEKEQRFVQYEYQISPSTDFKKPLQESHTPDGVVATTPAPNGTYYYRVRGVGPDGQRSAWSPAATYEVAMTADLAKRPGAPVLARKRFEFDPQAEKKRAPASVPAPEIRWSKVPEAKSYKVQFSRDNEFTKPINFDVQGTSMKWPDYKGGRWNVRVQAISNEGIPGEPSQTSLLQVMLDVPLLQPLKSYEMFAKNPEDRAKPVEWDASWAEVAGARSYLFQMDTNEKFEKPTELKVAGRHTKVSVEKPGTYFVRLRALDAQGNPLTNYSPVEKAVYNFRDWLKAPVLTEPFNQASIFLQTTSKPLLWLEWKGVTEAKAYEVELATDKNFQKRVLLTKVDSNRLLLKEQIPVGAFYWRVRAHGAHEEISNWTDIREFRIFSQKNEVFSQ